MIWIFFENSFSRLFSRNLSTLKPIKLGVDIIIHHFNRVTENCLADWSNFSVTLVKFFCPFWSEFGQILQYGEKFWVSEFGQIAEVKKFRHFSQNFSPIGPNLVKFGYIAKILGSKTLHFWGQNFKIFIRVAIFYLTRFCFKRLFINFSVKQFPNVSTAMFCS